MNEPGLKVYESMLIQFQTSRTPSFKVLVFSCPGQLNRWPSHSLTQSETFDFSVYNDNDDYNDYNNYNDYNEYNEYNDYNDYHDYKD